MASDDSDWAARFDFGQMTNVDCNDCNLSVHTHKLKFNIKKKKKKKKLKSSDFTCEMLAIYVAKLQHSVSRP